MQTWRMMAVAAVCAASVASAQSLPATLTRPATSTAPATNHEMTTAPATASDDGIISTPATSSRPSGPESPATMIERKLDGTITELSLNGVGFAEAIDAYKKICKVNIAVNWIALEKIGVTKETPVWMHVRQMEAEQTLRLLLEGMGTEKGRLQYAVSDGDGGGLIEISTMEGLGKDRTAKIFDGRKLAEVTMPGASVDDKGLPRQKIELVIEMIENDLAGLGEPEEQRKLRYDEKTGKLILMGSLRAVTLGERALVTFGAVVLWRQPTPKAVLPPMVKKTQEIIATKISGAKREHTLVEFADYLADVGKLKVVVMPGAVDGTIKKTVEIDEGTVEEILNATAKQFGVAWEIFPNGTIVFARKEQVAWHAILGSYDVREVIKNMSKNNGGVTKSAGMIVAWVKENVEGASAIAIIDGILVFRVHAEGHRKFAKDFDVWVKKQK